MLRHTTLLAAGLVALAGCKIVAKSDDGDGAVQDDATRMAALVDADWDARVLPRLQETAVPADEVFAAISADFTAATEKFGAGTRAEGAPSTFVVRGEGEVVEANLESRAARLTLDLDGDGGADADIQLGPVIRGTALRDALPFYEFTAFRDQIEFAKLANALNARAHDALPDSPAEVVGATVAFTGVFTLTGPDGAKEIVPLTLDWVAP